MKTWCYWNLHKACVSYKLGSNGYVSHSSHVVLNDVRFHVLATGRERVLKEKSKNVHSFVIGDLVKAHPVDARGRVTEDTFVNSGFRKAYYNPYKTETWVDAETGNVLENASQAIIQDKQVWYKED